MHRHHQIIRATIAIAWAGFCFHAYTSEYYDDTDMVSSSSMTLDDQLNLRRQLSGNIIEPPLLDEKLKQVDSGSKSVTNTSTDDREQEATLTDAEEEEVAGSDMALIERDHEPTVKTTLTVYLADNNKAAYSLFQVDILPKYGSGRIHYDVQTNVCDIMCESKPIVPNGPCLALRRPSSHCHLKHLQCMYPTCNYMIVNDEKCKVTDESYSLRQYYSSSLGDRVYLPLGPRHDSWMAYKRLQKRTPNFTLQPSSERMYSFNAIFSQQTHSSRTALANTIQTHNDEIKQRSNRRLSSSTATGTASAVAGRRRDFTRMPEKWGSRQMLSTDEYVDVLSKSIFTLNPAGHNPECYRMYEAIEAGSIPIMLKSALYDTNDILEANKKVGHPCEDSLIHWRTAPIVELNSWDDLYSTVDTLMEDTASLDRMQQGLMQWYTAHMHKLVVEFENHTLNSTSTHIEEE